VNSDNHYFGSTDDRIISCSIYLEPTDTENGCLQVLPKSHLRGPANESLIRKHEVGDGIYGHGEWTPVSVEEEGNTEDVVCPAGTIALFSGNLVHRARQNVTKDRTGFMLFNNLLSQYLRLRLHSVERT